LRLYHFLKISDDESHIPATISQKVNATGEKYQTAIPERFQAYLAARYLPQLEILSRRFGYPVTYWLQRAKTITKTKDDKIG
jgi:hypothetical protein